MQKSVRERSPQSGVVQTIKSPASGSARALAEEKMAGPDQCHENTRRELPGIIDVIAQITLPINPYEFGVELRSA